MIRGAAGEDEIYIYPKITRKESQKSTTPEALDTTAQGRQSGVLQTTPTCRQPSHTTATSAHSPDVMLRCAPLTLRNGLLSGPMQQATGHTEVVHIIQRTTAKPCSHQTE
ncbi:hypothetical protein BaRGS_00012362 [Batillaria attramentaria]|uniref:Uncharacterized protein n=1 Tax=Batillaria attramentaria TaxID=370345 RepID=A0ABD0LAS0_9CAEN